MDRTADVQGTVIGAGTLAAIVVLLYGTLVDETLAGVETVTLAAWLFAATLTAIALLHAAVAQYDTALGFGGAAVGWLFVLLGSGVQILVGLLLLLVSGAYVALVAVRRRPDEGPEGDGSAGSADG